MKDKECAKTETVVTKHKYDDEMRLMDLIGKIPFLKHQPFLPESSFFSLPFPSLNN